jgi:hypothetical protein
MLAELARREKEQHIRPDPDIDAYMKVSVNCDHLGFIYVLLVGQNIRMKTESSLSAVFFIRRLLWKGRNTV